MEYPLDISITAPFGIGDQVALIEFEGGAPPKKVTLRGGHFSHPQPLRPMSIKLTLETPEPRKDQTPATSSSGPAGAPVDLDQLYQSGVAIPSDGKLTVQVIWGCHCHSDALPHQ